MTDPLRWTDDGADASAFERELLSEGQRVGLSTAQKQQAWAGIVLQAAPAAAGAAGSGGAAATGAAASGAATGQSLAPGATQAGAWGLGSKIVGIASLLGALGGGYWASSKTEVASHVPTLAATPSPVFQQELSSAASNDTINALRGDPLSEREQLSVSSAPALSVSSAPARQSQTDQQSHSTQQSRPSSSTNSAQRISALTNHEKVVASETRQLSEQEKRASRLREESVAVLEIRRTLRAGSARQALVLLQQAQQNFPDGVLGQEREALTIEALVGSGAKAQAVGRAQAFLKDYPKSPFAADVKKFATP